MGFPLIRIHLDGTEIHSAIERVGGGAGGSTFNVGPLHAYRDDFCLRGKRGIRHRPQALEATAGHSLPHFIQCDRGRAGKNAAAEIIVRKISSGYGKRRVGKTEPEQTIQRTRQ